MTDIYSSRGGVTTSTDEKARRAVKEFRRMQPMLSAFARMITGLPEVRVVMDAKSNGMTDGKKIMYKPPIELGDPTPHNRSLCDKRDEQMQQRCAACRVRESVYVTIFHEIGHIAHGTFEETSDTAKVEVLKRAVEVSGSKYAAALDQRIKKAPAYTTSNYLGLAGMISPFLPFLVNCLEDARINSEVFRARKGTKVMFFADTWKIFGEGVEQVADDGTVSYKLWKDYPLNQQAAIGVFCIASGYDYSQWLSDEVVAALRDDTLTKLCRRLDTVRSVEGTYELSFPVLARLRELGFMKNPSDPDTPEEEEKSDDDTAPQGENDEAEGESEGDDAQSPPGEGQPEAGEGREDGDDSAADPAGEDEGSPSTAGDSDESDQEAGAGGGVGDQDSSSDDEADSDQPGDGAGNDPEGRSEESSGGKNGDNSEGGTGESGDSADGDEPGGSSNQSGSSEGEGELTDEDSGSSGKDQAPQEPQSSGEGSGDPAGEAGVPEDGDSEPMEDRSGNGAEDVDAGGDDGEGVDSDDPLREREGGPSDGGSGDDVGSESGDVAEGGSDLDAAESDDAHEGDADADDPSLPQGDEDAGRGADDSAPDQDTTEGDAGNDGSRHDQSDNAAESASDTESSDTDELIDTGADEGLGGVPVTETDKPFGEPEDMTDLHEIAHPEERPSHVEVQREGEEDMERAIMQGVYFETPSTNIFGVREHHYGQPVMVNNRNTSGGWDHTSFLRGGYSREALGVAGEFETSESILGPALLKMRVAFSDNERGASVTNRKSGKINTRVLGKRAHHGDERLFKKRILPGKKSYFVLIGIDISGSTVGKNIVLAKQAAFAQASLCHRLGIKFAVYCHSGSAHNPGTGRNQGVDLDIYHIKGPDEAWSDAVQNRLIEIGPDSANIDGHTMEYYRKILDTRTETHKVMLYYTDGKMPAENHDEELVILRREIKTCRSKKYTLIGVGIRTDSPKQHGLDTVQVDTEADVIKVVTHLEKRLLEL